MREFLRGLELDPEMIDCIMAEYGKNVTRDKEEITSLKGEILSLRETSRNAIELQDKYNELAQQIEQDNANKKAQAEEEVLNKNIIEAIGDKKFINDYTKNYVINEVKTALKDEANLGKSAKDVFTEITQGKNDMFLNPNQIVDMPNVNEGVPNGITKDVFDKMGYQERVELKQSNPELFERLNK